MRNRLFFPQSALDNWLIDAKVDLQGTELTVFADSRKFRLTEAVHVQKEVTGGPDPHELVGRVKSRAFLEELGAEILESSMVLGDNAYDVSPGWLGTPLAPPSPDESVEDALRRELL